MKISIVTCTRNEAKTLRHALLSVKAQNYPDIEHIVVDGRSVDDTAAVVADFDGVKIVERDPHGVYDALNYGFSIASGDILGFVHGNDRIPRNDVLSSVAREFEADPDLDFIYGNLRYIKPRTHRHVRIYYAGEFTPNQLSGGMAPPHPTLYMRRRVFDRVGLYRLDMRNAADFEMWIRLFNDKSLKYKYIPMVLAEMTTGGRSASPMARLIYNNREKLRALRLHGMPACPLRLPQKYLIVMHNLFSAPTYE